MSAFSVDASDGPLYLRTGVEGPARRLGHDLRIAVTEWAAAGDITDGRLTELVVTAEVASLLVIDGTGGVRPLSDKDRATIVKNAQKTLQSKAFPQIVFTLSEPLEVATTTSGRLHGTLSIAGRAHPVTLSATRAGTRSTVRGRVRQSEFGVSAYSTMLGQLRVADAVDITAEFVLPAQLTW